MRSHRGASEQMKNLLFLGTLDVHRRDWRALVRRMRLLRLDHKRQKMRVTVSTQTLLGKTSCSKLRGSNRTRSAGQEDEQSFRLFCELCSPRKTDRRTTFRENERRGDGNSGHSAEIGAHWATGKTTMKFRKMRRMDKFRPAYSQLL